MYKCALTTLGCKVNQCETQALAKLMADAGYQIVPFQDAADVYIINTCCVTAEGERKSRQTVGRALEKNPDAVIAVTGCAAQKNPEEFRRLPGVSLVAGTARRQELVFLIQQKHTGVQVTDINQIDTFEELPDAFDGEHTRAFIKIQDGCNNFCTYCIIPHVRGRERSRSLEAIRQQAVTLAEQGFKEIVLNGIHLSAYGKEWAFAPSLADTVLAAAEPAGIRRVRLGSLEPTIITDTFLEKVCSTDKFCRQYHLSLQAGSNSVLKRMNRHYTTSEYEAAVNKIRAVDPDAAISTDIIVGFPGETEEEFQETLAFAKKMGFAWVHVFPFSRREGTPAERMVGQLPKDVKTERAHQLSRLCEDAGSIYRSRFIGSTKEVLCEHWENGQQNGLTREHLSVVFFNPMPMTNELVSIRMTSVTADGLAGEMEK